jgi:hypothetical protein
VLAYSLHAVKVRRRYVLHRNLQVALGVVLLVAVVLFEIDVQGHGGWEKIVARRTPPLAPEQLSQVRTALAVHLVFAVSTPVLWATTFVLAWRRFSRPPAPGAHSRVHRLLGWLSAVDLGLTSATGLAFYYLAFVR